VTLSKSCFLAGLAAWIALGQAQQPASAAVELQRAAYLQRTVGDLDAAIQSYRQIIASRPADRAIVAQAENGLAQALQQKGDPAGTGQDSRPKAAVVEGKVVNQVTGAPLKKTMLTLSPSTVGGIGRPATAESDDEGRFSFPSVVPGNYTLRGERAGYASQSYNAHGGNVYGAWIPLKEGEELKNIVFKLVPNALLSGKVLDEDGDPVSRASVWVLRYTYRTSGKLLQSFANGMTGANGEFSVSVPPGRYYLVTSNNTNNNVFVMNGVAISQSAPSAKPPEDAPELAYGPMFYPNSPDELGAAPIDAAAGADLRGMDIHLAKVKTYRIRGQIAESSPQTRMLQLIPKTVSAASNLMAKATSIQPDRSFEFVNVLPGTYNLLGNGEGGTSIYRSPIVVTNRHISGLPAVLSPMGELKGTVTIEGVESLSGKSLTGFDGSKLMVGFDSFENGSNPMVTVGDDGTFSIRGTILPDRYHPWVGHQPKGCWVKAIRYENRDVKDEGIDLTNGITGPVEVVLSRNAGDVSGVIVDEDGKPVPGATVILLPKSATYLTRYAAGTDYQGKFEFQPVRPGEYTVLAWEDAAYLSWFDPEFLKPFMSKGVALSVTENDKRTLSVKAISAKDTQR